MTTSACLPVLAALMLWALPAVALVDQPPLVDTMDSAPRACRPLARLRVPLRSSGGDIVSLYANRFEMSDPPAGPFDRAGLDVDLVLQNDIRAQVQAYLDCDTPVMKATQAMLNAVADITEADPRTEMVAVFQYGWSHGNDVVVAREHVRTPADLSGATIVIQAYGPHLGYLARVLADARRTVQAEGGSWTDPDILYTADLLGMADATPAGAFLADPGIDAAFVTRSDADILTAGDVGTGAEGSVQGAHALMSTKSASRVISDVLVVRRDYFEANQDQVQTLVQALFTAEEQVREDVVKQIVPWEKVAGALLRDDGAEAEARALWSGYETGGLNGNVTWADPAHPRSFKAVNDDIQSHFVSTGLLGSAHGLAMANWDWQATFGGNIFDKRMASLPGFDDAAATGAVRDLRESGDVGERTLFTFEITFEPNQSHFPVVAYDSEFEEVTDLASTYAGAVLTVEGHSDPLKYLRTQRDGGTPRELDRIRKSAENLSLTRAIAVRDAIIDAADETGVKLDTSQFVVSGLGITDPKTGMCGADPCPPRTEQEWRSNMRVVFRLMNLESEATVFTPPNEW